MLARCGRKQKFAGRNRGVAFAACKLRANRRMIVLRPPYRPDHNPTKKITRGRDRRPCPLSRHESRRQTDCMGAEQPGGNWSAATGALAATQPPKALAGRSRLWRQQTEMQ